MKKPVVLKVLNPLSKVAITVQNARRLGTLEGKTVAEVSATGGWGADRTFPIIRELLQKRFPGIKFVPYTEFPHSKDIFFWVPLEETVRMLMDKGCDAVLIGNAGGGAAAHHSALGVAAEKAGIPAALITGPEWPDHARMVARGNGLASLPVITIPQKVLAGEVMDARPSCEAAIKDIVHALTEWQPEKTENENAASLMFEGASYEDATSKASNDFMSRGWGDGLPIVPPTEESVSWMMTGTGLNRLEVLGTRLTPKLGTITVETVAINAVMAGARPEYLPVILAVVEQLGTPQGRKQVHFLQEGTAMAASVLIVNGPIVKELNINSAFGVMGPGWQANATIGRAISLLLINAGGGQYGPAGAQRQSLPGRYTWCIGENESQNPWSPLNAELGYGAIANTVTVMVGRGNQTIMMHPPMEKVLGSMVRAFRGITVGRCAVPWEQLLLLSPAHAKLLAENGWSKKDLRTFIYNEARLSQVEADAAGIVPSADWEYSSPSTSGERQHVPMTNRPEDLLIVVAGGQGGSVSTLVPCMERSVTGLIDRYKSTNWDGLIQKAKKDLRY
ncbi:MAG: hypothetical protein HYX83_00850 [Chloroflexi bacterium]|nr:hypothetical protein [Chloroflexota bacterium]